jgi:hypothetical protein
MRLASLFLLFAMAMLGLSDLSRAQQARAQAGVQLEEVEARVDFGEQVLFLATIKSSTPIESASIVISAESQGMTFVEPLTVQPDGSTEFRFDTKLHVLRPFTELKWNYQINFPDGSTVQSEPFFVRYTDDRFDWQRQEAGALKVNWYQGDAGFGQAALQAAQEGVESIRRLVSLDLAGPVEIFVYANTDDLRGTLAPGSEEWVAGHADPSLGVVMVSVEPGAEQGLLMEQRIPHELMHILLFRQVGAGYHQIPVWLREGMATLAEMYPNPDYEGALADAVAADGLIPLKDLCGSFPPDAGQAFLAYAQSRSFTQYLHDSYGATGLLGLAETYADGVDCERGPEQALGVSLSRLEADWHASVLRRNSFRSALEGVAPYLALLCLVLIIPLVGIATTFRKKGNRNGSETYVRK